VLTLLLRYKTCLMGLALLCKTLFPSTAFAKTTRQTVIVFGASESTAFAQEAISRLQGELRAAGYEPQLQLVNDLANVETQFASVADDTTVAAVFVLREGQIKQTAEFLLWQPSSQRQQRREIDLSQEPPVRAARLLAIRVAEFLRSQTAILPPAEVKTKAEEPTATAAEKPAPTSFRATLQPQLSFGVASLTDSFRSPSFGIYANAALARHTTPNLDLVVRVSWFGQVTDRTITASEGQAELSRQMFCLELGANRYLSSRFSAFGFASAGAHRLSSSSQAQPGFEGRSNRTSTAIAGGILGARARLSTHVSVEAAFGMWALANAPDLYIAGRNLQTLGRPTELALLSVVGSL